MSDPGSRPSDQAGVQAEGPLTRAAAPSAPARIVHIVAPGRVGGLESVVRALAAGHHHLGHSVQVLSVIEPGESEGHPFHRGLREAGVGVVPIALAGRSYLRERRAVRSALAEFHPHLVHTHGYRPDVLASGVARSLGIPTVTTVHGFTGGDWKNRLYEWVQLHAFRRFDAVVAVSRPLQGRLLRSGVAPARTHLIPNAWGGSAAPLLDRASARRQLGIGDQTFVVGWVGRLGREKGPDLMISALRGLDEATVASFVGEGRERQALELLAAELGVAPRIRWHGTIPEASRLYAAFDVFVLSSRTEGTPISLFEAMAAHVPIVATRVGGVPDVVSETEAVLVPAEDPSALAAGIRAVRADPAAARTRAGMARLRLENQFAIPPWLRRYEQLYQALAATPLRSGRS